MYATIEEQLGKLLKRKGYKIAVAESCTGGLVGNYLTDNPGSSNYFPGGVITYSNESKKRLLNVKSDTLDKYGAVSRETALEMAAGVRNLFSSDFDPDHLIGMSVTGIAGPDGGSPEKPVGLVWIGMSTPSGCWAWKFNWNGTRLENKKHSAKALLMLLWRYLSDENLEEN